MSYCSYPNRCQILKKAASILSLFIFTTVIFTGELMTIQAFTQSESSKKFFTVNSDTIPNGKNKILIEKHLKILQGNWVHVKDSLAKVKIHGTKWVDTYEDSEKSESQIYDIIIVDSIQIHHRKIDGTYLLLIHNRDTLKYSIDYLTEDHLSLLYLPIGRFHDYKKVE
jgi:hypothetical protein